MGQPLSVTISGFLYSDQADKSEVKSSLQISTRSPDNTQVPDRAKVTSFLLAWEPMLTTCFKAKIVLFGRGYQENNTSLQLQE